MTVAGVVDPAHQAHDIVSNPEATMAASHDRWNAIADGHVSSTLAKYWNNPGTALAQDVYTAKHSMPLVQGALHALDRTPVGVALEHADAYTVALAGNLIGGTAHLAVHQAELYGPILNEYVVPGGYAANRAMGITDPFANARKAWHRDPAGTAAEGLSALASVFGGVAGATRAGAAEGAAAGAGRSAATKAEPPAVAIPRGDGPGRLIKRDPNRRSAPLTNPTGDRPLGGAGQRPSNRSDTAGNRPPAGPVTRTPNRQEPNNPQLADAPAGLRGADPSADSLDSPLPPSNRSAKAVSSGGDGTLEPSTRASGQSGKEASSAPPPENLSPLKDEYVDLYHGTDKISANNIRENGIDLSEQRSNTDFGRGFYVTKDIEQAREWARKRETTTNSENETGEILHYRVPRGELENLQGRHFTAANKEFANFVRQMRLQSGSMHAYDWVEGPMLRNVRGFLRRNEPPRTSGHQLSMHTPQGVGALERNLEKSDVN